MNGKDKMKPVIDEQTSDLFLEEWLCDLLADPVDISTYLEEMGRTPGWVNADADHQSCW
jgi:hypothetical protein